MMSCPVCGFDESRLAKSLRLGCPTCYTTFAPHIATFLPRLHRGVTHTGKQPPVPTIAELEHRIDRLVEKVQALAPDSREAKELCQLQATCRAAFAGIRRHNRPS
jgi:protein-arginine kinase activator protein McsA